MISEGTAAAAAAAAPAAASSSSSSSSASSAPSLSEAVGLGALRLAEQLRAYVPQNALPDINSPTSRSIADLQLAICRKLRELLPSNRELLHTAQTSHWIPVLLSWLNLHDRPEVQVEALLAVTCVAELCCAISQSATASAAAAVAAYGASAAAAASSSSSSSSSSSAVSAAQAVAAAAQAAAVSGASGGSNAAAAAAAAAAASNLSLANSLSAAATAAGTLAATSAADQSWTAAVEAAASKYGVSSSSLAKYNPYLTAAAAAAAAAGASAPAPGSVPFPPLSFSQTLSPEAVAAFDSSLSQTILACQDPNLFGNLSTPGGASATPAAAAAAATALSSWSLPAAPLFPTSAPTSAGGINFTSLAPPPGGAHNAVLSNAFLPPPTPVTAPNFPQQLSAGSQHMLLRHADAIPTLIGLLTSPRREVYEQAAWILGSIAAGDSHASSAGSAAAAASASAVSGSGSSGSGGGASGSTVNITVGPSGAVNINDAHHRDGTAPGGASTSGGSGSGSSSLGNGASGGKTVSARDVILAAGVMSQLIWCLEQHPENLSLQRIGSWTLSNLVDGIFQQPPSTSSQSTSSTSRNNNSNSSSGKSSTGSSTTNPPDSSLVPSSGGPASGSYSSADEIDMNVLLPVLRRLLRSPDAEVLGYTCWALSHLCDGPSSHIAAIVTSPSPDAPSKDMADCGLVPRLVELLAHPSWRVTKPALRTIGNIVCAECGDDADPSTDYTEVILDCQAVPRLKQLVEHNNREIQKEACWTLSNIAAGTVDQIQAVIDSGAIPPLVKLVKDKKTDHEVRSEACWVVLNATSCGSDAQIEVLVDEGCVSVLGVLLSEASMVTMALEGLERVLQVEETRGVFRPTPLVTAELIEQAREPHNASSVVKRADRIWKAHFVQCALCKQSFSRHRGEAHFCEECKCFVCGGCDCLIYHLSYQEDLWAATEEQSEAKKNAKKSKNKKKKAKKKAKQLQEEEKQVEDTRDADDTAGGDDRDGPATATSAKADGDDDSVKRPASPLFEYDDDEDPYPVVDFVQYLQQTGSILALAKLMDSLEDGDEEDLNEYERRMIREQRLLREQAALNPAH